MVEVSKRTGKCRTVEFGTDTKVQEEFQVDAEDGNGVPEPTNGYPKFIWKDAVKITAVDQAEYDLVEGP